MTFWIKMTFLPSEELFYRKGSNLLMRIHFVLLEILVFFLCVSKMTNLLLFGQKKRIENIICAIIKNGEFGNI